MATRKRTNDSKVLTLKVTLVDSAPPIWRRLEVLSSMTLGNLHYTVQIAMGWTNSHLHDFHIAGRRYGRPHSDDAIYGDAPLHEDTITLSQVVKRKGSKMEYQYDFGDSWEHEILLEGIAEPEPSVYYPRCVAGEMRCPPDDCGGLYGYYDMLEILKDPEHEEYETWREWLPSDFAADAFDLTAINAELHRINKWRGLA